MFAATIVFAADPIVPELGKGIDAYTSRDYAGAVRHLHAARQISELTDYVTYYTASSLQQLGDYEGALAVLDAWRTRPMSSSPLVGKIGILHARVLVDKADAASAAKAISILMADYDLLPQPDGDYALGLAWEAKGDRVQAATAYQRVYYSFPANDFAASAAASLERLRAALGDSFPKPAPRQQLDRAGKWIAARQYVSARQEYAALAQSLTGPDRDEATVGVGVAQFMGGDATAAARSLSATPLLTPDAEAERLYYLVEASRRTGDDPALIDAVKQLGDRFPQSGWRLRALISAGNRFVAAGDRERYEELFHTACEVFPTEPASAQAHWKLTWDMWMEDKPARVAMLREQVEHFPDDSRASSALYYLGRAAELESKFGAARAYFDHLDAQFPHYFYGVLARQRGKDAKLTAAVPDPEVKVWLRSVLWPTHRDLTATDPNPATRARIERTRLLMDAGLPDLADAEIRFAAKQDGEQTHLLALELARSAPSPFRALRVMKSLSADYLSLPTSNAPDRFWQMLFPLPYKDDLFRNAVAHELDPYSVAGLIRQESEFNPGAKSPANAYGLMQLLPVTGREMARKLGSKGVATAALLDPATNIRLGTQYLKSELDHWMGDWTQTLAAYNAGPSRVRQWTNGLNFREPAEFVESIPFNETREYVQAVLRNADMYRELYANRREPAPEKLASATPPKAAPRPVVKKAAVAMKRAVPAAPLAKKSVTPHPGAPVKRDPA